MPDALPLYVPLPTPEEMRQWDEGAHSLYAIPPLLLMENAARAALEELKRHKALLPESHVLIFAGKGNNGGDGMALARLLHDEGLRVLVHCLAPLADLPSPAREHAAMAAAMGVNFLFADAAEKMLEEFPEASGLDAFLGLKPDIIVDALMGTGIKGELRPQEQRLVRLMNACRRTAFIFSLDIPSGLCGLTGKPRPLAVRAHATVCFEAGKPGLFFPEACDYTGEVAIRRVGIPLEMRARIPSSWQLLRPRNGAWAAASRLAHKGSAGSVLIVGGSEGMAGAPVLAALGSLRAGAGLVHVALPEGLEPAVRAGWPEVLTHPLGQSARWRAEDAEPLLDLIRRLKPRALVVGPGMGRDAAVGSLVKALLEEKTRPPVLLDADALYFLRLPQSALSPASSQVLQEESQAPCRLLNLLRPEDILTPHPGEMARLLPQTRSAHAGLAEESDPAQRIRQVQDDRPAIARLFTRHCPATLVLKGPGTLIACAGKAIALSPFAVSTLAVGGSGDVLAGVCAALTAAGFTSRDAASLGVYLHGRAGELLAARAGRGHLAREIAEAVPAAWEELCRS